MGKRRGNTAAAAEALAMFQFGHGTPTSTDELHRERRDTEGYDERSRKKDPGGPRVGPGREGGVGGPPVGGGGGGGSGGLSIMRNMQPPPAQPKPEQKATVLTLQQRQQLYEEARNRIFNSAPSPPQPRRPVPAPGPAPIASAPAPAPAPQAAPVQQHASPQSPQDDWGTSAWEAAWEQAAVPSEGGHSRTNPRTGSPPLRQPTRSNQPPPPIGTRSGGLNWEGEGGTGGAVISRPTRSGPPPPLGGGGAQQPQQGNGAGWDVFPQPGPGGPPAQPLGDLSRPDPSVPVGGWDQVFSRPVAAAPPPRAGPPPPLGLRAGPPPLGASNEPPLQGLWPSD
eukprot:Hpha_TRINITY_DN15645_c0_g2::TRINITY_DN15645_c0_g2_i1::g.100475::m.100475